MAIAKLPSSWGPQDKRVKQLFRRISTIAGSTTVLFLLTVYRKKMAYKVLNNILPLIYLEVLAMSFIWLLGFLCRVYGAFPQQKAVKAGLAGGGGGLVYFRGLGVE